MKPTIIIADDHPLVLKGLQDFLIEKDFNILASAKNGKEALSLIKAHTPDIAILDIKMPFLSGLEIAAKCRAEQITTKIIVITFEKDENIYNEAKSLGVYGYILKEFALEEIEVCIASVQTNKAYFSPDLLKFIELQERPKYFDDLTLHEKNIVKLISNNKTGVEIADVLSISTRTVEKHKSNIIRKLKLESKQNSLLIWAKENSTFINS
ncbi:response regulator [Winogradskyella bathintestinalis]|uniref:Response regulator transcription factor n=1 Tax=Winogradskyella bathintestinalis TaxID=3035208 RepID=A0ABT7ZSG1_9FLAO|nr:response regulator transcription factor [Winogradskyella bathintestinalis]MDN3491952.1 response regulator transcription factor [Winogradskyella bathintestinalis]